MLPEGRIEVDRDKIKPGHEEKLHESLMVVGVNGDITPLTTGMYKSICSSGRRLSMYLSVCVSVCLFAYLF